MIKELWKEAMEANQRRMIVLSLEEFEKIKDELGYYIIFSDDLPNARKFKEVREIMGKTIGNVVIDARKGFLPSDFGIIVGAVKGGSLIILIKEEPWKNEKFHAWMESPNNPKNKFKDYFLKWFDEKLKNSEGIYYENYVKPKVVKKKKNKIKIPECDVDERILKIAATQDQANALAKLSEMNVSILIADRGRGKSSAVGLFIADVVKKKPYHVCITAPKKDNAEEVFKFLEKGLNALGVKFSKFENKYIIGRAIVEFVEPYDVLRRRWDLIVVDEAAAIPVNLLLRILDRSSRVIFSTTIHGYEGGGRSFYIRFLGTLQEKNVEFQMVTLKEPIRYSEDDPIEKFVFDALLLNAEPEDVDEVDLSKLKLVVPDKKELIKNEKILRSYFGIFVLAHYKNNPNDLALILDAPAHIPAYLEYDGKVVAALHLAKEGNLDDETIDDCYDGLEINGELISDRVIRHYRMPEFGKYKGIRIVRIAVHPFHMDEGIGSVALKLIEKKFKYDWIGSSFGATPKLMNFWIKNGYYPIHASPARNKTTGEYSFIVLKSKVKEYHVLVDEFVKKIFNSLDEPYNDLEIEIIRMLKRIHTKDRLPALTQVQWRRLKAYLDGILTYEVTHDAIKEIVYSYFLTKADLLDEETEKILIAKVLQFWPMDSMQNFFHMPLTAIYSRVKKGVARIFEYYKNRLSLNFID